MGEKYRPMKELWKQYEKLWKMKSYQEARKKKHRW